MATCSSVLAWRIPGMGEPGGLPSMGSHRVGHNWSDLAVAVKAMVFPVVMYGCESWTVKKAECWRIDTFELWCWRRLLRVPWTARISNQSILKEINPEYYTRLPHPWDSPGKNTGVGCHFLLQFVKVKSESEKWKWSPSVMSDSLRPHGRQPTRLLCPWDFPGKSTGVGCHCLPRRQCIRESNSESRMSFQSHLTSWVTLSKSLNLAEPHWQFSHLSNHNKTTLFALL